MAGRVALVTGGTRGIGAAISRMLKLRGYNVAANYAGNDVAASAFKEETGIAGLQVRRQRLRRREGGGGADREGSRADRDRRQQRRHHPRFDHAPARPHHVAGRDRHQPRLLLQRQQGGVGRHEHARLRPHRQYRLDQRPGRPVRPGQLRRRQVGHPRLHQGAGAGRRVQGHHRERHRAGLHRHRHGLGRAGRRCSRRSSPRSRSAGSARPTRSRAACCS